MYSMYIHTYIRTYVHTYIHTHIHIHIYVIIYVLVNPAVDEDGRLLEVLNQLYNFSCQHLGWISASWPCVKCQHDGRTLETPNWMALLAREHPLWMEAIEGKGPTFAPASAMKLHQSCRGFFPCPVPLRNFVLAAWMNETFWIPENIETYLEAEPRQEVYIHIYIYICMIYIYMREREIYIYIWYIYIHIFMHITIWIMPWAVDLTGQFFDDLSVVDLQQRPWTGKGNHPNIPSSRLGFLNMGHLWAPMGTPNLREFWCSHVFGPTRYDKMFGADGQHNLWTAVTIQQIFKY